MNWVFLLLIPVAGACVYWLMTSVCMALFFRHGRKRCRFPSAEPGTFFPFVSLIKPVCGLEKNLYENLATACLQDYPRYEVIYSAQREDDPALKILYELNDNYPNVKMQIVVNEYAVGPNGRLANLYNAAKHAEGEILVFSDSDMFLKPDYLKNIVAPFADPAVGVSCTLYKAWAAYNLPEKLELLSFNADFIPAVVFARVTGASLACSGASQAVSRSALEAIGGLAPLGNYLVEDFELGRRIVDEKGFKMAFAPHVAATGVDLENFREWWRHQVYWDQNTRAANPAGFFFTILIRGVPFAVIYATLQGPWWPQILAVCLGARLFTAAVNSTYLGDHEGLRALWLLPLRDSLGLFVWLASFLKRKTFWKGRTFILKKGKMMEVTPR